MQEFRKRFSGETGTIPGLPEWESELLWSRGIDTPEKAAKFLNPAPEDLHDPLLMQDMEKAVTLIRMAIRRGDSILVYGDYDVDGISAVAILTETLQEEGAEVSYRIPDRHSEGYGLNEKAVREIAGKYRMLITVDCGISNVREVRLAKELGMCVIVTDHHEIPEELPPADAVLNPLLGNYPFRRLCGAGVALKICQAMRGMESVMKKMEIAALATVADIVPLTDENRVIVREGMARMEYTDRPGLRALAENARISFPMHADDIAFRLGPRLNAAGRLEDASQGVRVLTTADPEEAREIAGHLEENNRRRQENEQQILREAMECFPRQVNLERDRVVILEGEGWNTGLIGLAAGKLCERLHHPVIVLSRQGENAAGSCRSIPGINIWQMLNLCGDLFIRFGGHEQAAGLTIPTGKIPELRTRLNEAVRTHCDDRCFLPVREYDSEIPLKEVTLKLIQDLEALEPTGFGNPAPVFLCRNAFVQEARKVGRDQSHLKLTLAEDGAVRDGIGFGLGREADRLNGCVDALFRPARNEFNGKVTVQLQVQALQPPEQENPEEEDPDGFFLKCMQEMSFLPAKKTDHAAAELRPEHLLKERMDQVSASREDIAAVYLALKDDPGADPAGLAKRAGTSGEQVLFCLTAFEQLGLVRWEKDPFRAEILPVSRKMDLEQSSLVRYVRELQKDRQGS